MSETIKQNKSNVIKFLVPLVAAVVILESVVLMSSLSRKGKTDVINEEVVAEVTKASGGEETSFEVAVTGPNEVVFGESYLVEVRAIGRELVALDAVNLYVKYDASAFDISELVFDDRLPRPTFSKVSTQKSLLVVNYLVSDTKGLSVEKGESLSLLKFKAGALKVGSFDFEISTSKDSKESATMFVENATSKALPFSSSGLNVKVLK